MRQLEDIDFPTGAAERIITSLNINEDNIQELKDLIYFANELTISEVQDLVNELFIQLGI